jgi:hypothetical protein
MHNVLHNETAFGRETRSVEFCVVGGGMAGLNAAIAAARNGVKTILVQDRSVLGGNASSEIRMWICGAHGNDNKEAGILEEIMLRNLYYNADMVYTVWDDVLHGICREEPNLEVLFNCAVNEVHTHDRKITAIGAWHCTRQCWIDIQADLYADCSGDSVLRICGAETRWGREARQEFDESHAPEVADDKTMGNSILIQLRAVEGHTHPFIAPPWARKFKEEDLPNRGPLTPEGDNFWWLELGGMMNTIDDADTIRDENLAIAYGVWEMMKNHPDGRGDGWALEWIGSLPGKRENVRYVGDHILTQNDIEAEGRFEDRVCHGGWSMDDHHPEAINYKGKPTIFHPAPSPYGIPYRCLYVRDMDNLFCAGRNISATHMAMSSTRVMATTSTMGQAVGTAAAIATQQGLTPRGVYTEALTQLQDTLRDQDQYIPWTERPLIAAQRQGVLTVSCGAVTELSNGIERDIDGVDNGWWGSPGDTLTWRFPESEFFSHIRIISDSDFNDRKKMPCSYPSQGNRQTMPASLIKEAKLEGKSPDGQWQMLHEVHNNFRRLLMLPLDQPVQEVRLTLDAAWGGGQAHIFSFDLLA